jgi:pimeloyl-ACP methyl ester carboxylesterase
VISVLQHIPLPIESKAALTQLLETEHNLPQAMALWMTTNIQPNASKTGFEWCFDLDVVVSLFASYKEEDFFPKLAELAEHSQLGFVRAGRNTAWVPGVVGRLEQLQEETEGRVALHKVENAGHWVHIDAPKAVLATLADSLSQ